MSIYLTLGTSEIPIFGTGRTYDYMNILSDNCIIEISNDTDSNSYSLGTVKFTSKNTYFVDQSYIVEGGALILSQSKASILNGKPYFSISNFTNLSLNIIDISGLEGKTFAGGYGTYSFYMEYKDSNTSVIEDFNFINVTTNYPNAWHLFFNSSTLRNSGLTYDITDTVDGISVEFSETLGNLFLKVVDISAQIAPGLIE
jgi:hypothetical protein